mgnify:CR=1 FL=1
MVEDGKKCFVTLGFTLSGYANDCVFISDFIGSIGGTQFTMETFSAFEGGLPHHAAPFTSAC